MQSFKNSFSVFYRKAQYLYFLFNRKISNRNSGLVIIGCGRSGTTYLSKKFKALGIDIGHERLKRDGISSWYLVSDQKDVPIGPNYRQILKLKLPIVHQVREPLKAISSMQAIGWISYKFLSNEIPIDFENDSKVLKAMKFWYYWNLKAEKKSIFTYQVEQINDAFKKLIFLGNFKYVQEEIQIETNVNTRLHDNLSWSDLYVEDEELTIRIIELAKKYGYNL